MKGTIRYGGLREGDDMAEKLLQGSLAFACLLILFGGPASAQSPVAVDDLYEAPAGQTLVVEPIGILENDTDASGEDLPRSATALLVADVGHGSLTLASDGSFTYTPSPGFLGADSFTYQVLDGSLSSIATVTLDVVGCQGTLPLRTCWIESSFLSELQALGYATKNESFENDAVWGIARTPVKVPSVTSQGIVWTSNFAANDITTGLGAAAVGQWGIFSIPHGMQTGPAFAVQRDGFIGTSEGPPLFGVGGYVRTNTPPAAVEFSLTPDGMPPFDVGFINAALMGGFDFFGVIDTRGFTAFEVYETEGKVEDQKLIFSDHFTMATAPPSYCIEDVSGVLADTNEHFFWPPVPAATMYYAYLGVLPNPYNHVCIGGSVLPELTYTDDPFPGEALYFLFSAAADCGEGGLGAGRPQVPCTP